MPLYAFDRQDVGTHDNGEGGVSTLAQYAEELGADDVAEKVRAPRTQRQFMAAIRKALGVVQDLTGPGVVWELCDGELRLVEDD